MCARTLYDVKDVVLIGIGVSSAIVAVVKRIRTVFGCTGEREEVVVVHEYHLSRHSEFGECLKVHEEAARSEDHSYDVEKY